MRGHRPGPDRSGVGQETIGRRRIEGVAEERDLGVGQRPYIGAHGRHVLGPQQHLVGGTGVVDRREHRGARARVLGVDGQANPRLTGRLEGLGQGRHPDPGQLPVPQPFHGQRPVLHPQ
jgi:hypothetical protein